MIRPEKKREPARRFSVMIIPNGSSRVRRFELSRLAIKAAVSSVCAFGVLTLLLATGLLIYRHMYVTTEDVRVGNADYAVERAALLNRVSELEDQLSMVERFASKIESAMDRPKDSAIGPDFVSGKGPVDEESWLPVTERPGSSSASVRLNATKWRSPFSKSLTSGLRLKLDDMTDRLNSAEEKVHSVFALQKDRQYFWASLPTIWPTRGWITSEFGDGRRWGGRGRIHEGIDIAAPRGTPVLSPGSGIVTYSGYRHGYGKTLMIDHGYGIMTVYAHCQNLYSYEGQAVKRGMIIASVGNTGRSSGPHLHYEVHVDGMPVNPVLYVMDEM